MVLNLRPYDINVFNVHIQRKRYFCRWIVETIEVNVEAALYPVWPVTFRALRSHMRAHTPAE